MTTTAMEHPEDGVNPALTPVVLTIDNQHSQEYLTEDNHVLRALYGLELVRIDLETRAGALHHLLTPHDDKSFKELPALFPHLSWTTLKEFVNTPGYIEAVRSKFTEAMVKKAKIMSALSEDFTAAQMLSAVRVVLISSRLEENFVFDNICDGWLPNASFYCTDDRSIPRLARLTRRCGTCASSMNRAGSTFVCESCGSTRLS